MEASCKERPILFSAPMVRAILAGTKTQTRRVVKPQPRRVDCGVPFGDAPAWARAEPGSMVMRCPYGQPGDRLWARETWARDDEDGVLMYRADVGRDMNANAWEQGRLEGAPRYRWRPSIHMPRWASRITLEITGVRVERLQDISEGDAIAEGVNRFHGMLKDEDAAAFNRIGPVEFNGFPIIRYGVLWESINGPASWDANPWVWVVEFNRVGAQAQLGTP